jgi:endonuclease-3
MQKRSKYILTVIQEMFPDARCELNYYDLYQLSISVILSAQTTDKRVNMVTPTLFEEYPTVLDLANADQEKVEVIIQSIGLYKNKAKNIIAFAKDIVARFEEKIPHSYEDLVTLSGVGRKTANIILSEGYKIPRIAVDTHVERVSKRLQLAPINATVLEVEQNLMQEFQTEEWHQIHLSILFFGRYFCFAKNPKCNECPFYHKECIKK